MIGEFMNTKEAAIFLSLTERRVTGLCNEGGLAGAVKDGWMWYIPEKTLRIYKLLHPRGRKKAVGVAAVGDTD